MNNGDVIKLNDGNEYTIVCSSIIGNNKYYYIIDIKNNDNVKFCYIEDDNLTEIFDKEIISKILKDISFKIDGE